MENKVISYVTWALWNRVNDKFVEYPWSKITLGKTVTPSAFFLIIFLLQAFFWKTIFFVLSQMKWEKSLRVWPTVGSMEVVKNLQFSSNSESVAIPATLVWKCAHSSPPPPQAVENSVRWTCRIAVFFTYISLLLLTYPKLRNHHLKSHTYNIQAVLVIFCFQNALGKLFLRL